MRLCVSFILQMFIEYLLCAMQRSKFRKHSSELTDPSLKELAFRLGTQQTNKETDTDKRLRKQIQIKG